LPGRRILISPTWINRITWRRRHVAVGLDRQAIEQSPEYSNESQVTRDYEASLHRHYDRDGYWVDESLAGTKPHRD
jgi:stress response protein YsnF